MLEWFTDNSNQQSPVFATEMIIRLIAACLFGFLVAVSYWFHRHPIPFESKFPLTLVLLSILIAMVMQVIDDRVAPVADDKSDDDDDDSEEMDQAELLDTSEDSHEEAGK